jgi:ESSS subunit of NADH:ubiquinone oxidoreductase (complex I)
MLRSISNSSLIRLQRPAQKCAMPCYYGTTTTTTARSSLKPTIHGSRCSKPVVQQPQQNQQKRMMAGDSHMPKPQSEDAVLFGGHSPQPEGWETTIHVGYATSLILCCIVLFFEPETGIDNWANQEARARLKLKEEHGWTNDMFKFGVHYQNLDEDEVKAQWDKFSSKALSMNEDDDDDEEEEEEEDDDEEE